LGLAKVDQIRLYQFRKSEGISIWIPVAARRLHLLLVSRILTMVPLCQALGPRATLKLFEDADHSFHVPARSGRTDAQVRGEMADALAAWIEAATTRSG
jgi:hypothetical protein